MPDREAWSDQIRHCDRKRFAFMDKGIDKGAMPFAQGWIIDGTKVDEPWWKNIRAHAIPLTPIGGSPCEQKLANAQKQLGCAVCMFMIQDDETFDGWSLRAIRIDDLSKDPQQLRDEMDEAKRKEDWNLKESIRCAYLAVTGKTDIK